MIIGISGYARSGKDTLGDYLRSEHGFARVAFATPLKEATRTIFGFTDEQLYGELKEEIDPYWGFSPRWALQKLGTEGARDAIGEDVWVKAAMRNVLRNGPFSRSWVITDVRFRNEAAAIHAAGGLVVRDVRDDAKARQRVEGHASEDLSDVPYDTLIPNNGAKEELREYAQALSNHCKMAYALLVDSFAYSNTHNTPVPSSLHIDLGKIPFEDKYRNEVQSLSKEYIKVFRDLKFQADVNKGV
jgi:hypothetical protein